MLATQYRHTAFALYFSSYRDIIMPFVEASRSSQPQQDDGRLAIEAMMLFHYPPPPLSRRRRPYNDDDMLY